MARTLISSAWAVVLLLPASLSFAQTEKPVYELRTYHPAPGKLDVLVKRFGALNVPKFEQHQIKLLGAWVPADKNDPDPRLVYLVSFPNRDAAKDAWKAFLDDPTVKDCFAKEKEKHGTVVAKGESVFLKPTDYSPDADLSGTGRIYELRTYTASPGKMADLHKRFREHTIGLFEIHGLHSIGYSEPLDADKGAGSKLVYMLAFPNHEAADKAWQAFKDDPEWQKAKKESEADGIPLAAKVESVFLKPTDFSPLQ